MFGALQACIRPLYRITGQSLRASQLVYMWLCGELPGALDNHLYIPLGLNLVERAVCLTTPISAYDGPDPFWGVVIDNSRYPEDGLCPPSCRTSEDHCGALRTKVCRCRQLGQRIKDMESVSTFMGTSAAVPDAKQLAHHPGEPSRSKTPGKP